MPSETLTVTGRLWGATRRPLGETGAESADRATLIFDLQDVQ